MIVLIVSSNLTLRHRRGKERGATRHINRREKRMNSIITATTAMIMAGNMAQAKVT
jgi:hypothetical protein